MNSQQPKVFFRVEAGSKIGLGNLRRCVALAQSLKRYRSVGFISTKKSEAYIRDFAGDFDRIIVPDYTHYSDEIEYYPKYMDTIITDLGFPDNFKNPRNLVSYFKALQDKGIDVLMFDGLGDDSFTPADMPKVKACIQPYWGVEIAADDNRAEHYLNGPEYVLLGEEYRDVFCKRDADMPKNILVTFGGADPQGNTIKIMEGLCVTESIDTVKIIVGPYFSDEQKLNIERMVDQYPDRFECVNAPESLVPYYQKADLVICGSGATRYEAAACGLPALFTAIYESHITLSADFETHGTSQYIGFCEDLSAGDWTDAIIALQNDGDGYIKMVEALETKKDFGFGADNLARDIMKVIENGE